VKPQLAADLYSTGIDAVRHAKTTNARAAIDILATHPNALILVAIYIFICLTVSSHTNAWMQPEELHIKSYILKNGPQLKLEDIKRGLNYNEFEYAPRISRPLSSYFDILDTKFRCLLWKLIPPHPSVSLTWVLSLFLTPLALYKLLRNLTVSFNSAIAAVCLYLLSPGTLSSVYMLFRPAKPLVNFMLVCCLYMASTITLRISIGAPVRRNFYILAAILFISLFCDETAWVTYAALPVLFPRLLRRHSRLFVYLYIPVVAYCCYIVVIPALTEIAGWGWPSEFSYDLVERSTSAQYSWGAISLHSLTNCELLLLNSFGIMNLRFLDLHGSAFGVAMFAANLSALGAFLFYAAARICGIYWGRWRRLCDGGLERLLLKLCCLLLIFAVIHSVFMARSNIVWGLFYYGSYWAIPFAVCCAVVIQLLDMHRGFLFALLAIISINLGYTFLNTNAVYKRFHYYPCTPLMIREYFLGAFDPFLLQEAIPEPVGDVAHVLWRDAKAGRSLESTHRRVPKELLYALIEMWPGRYDFEIESLQRDAEIMYYNDAR